MTQKIDVEDLTLVMTALNSARVLLEEIHEDFWDALDPSQDAGLNSVYFPHNRAKSNAVDRLPADAVPFGRLVRGYIVFGEDETLKGA